MRAPDNKDELGASGMRVLVKQKQYAACIDVGVLQKLTWCSPASGEAVAEVDVGNMCLQ